jgi:hypothetical protein
MFKEKVFTEICVNGECKKSEYYREITDGIENVKKLTDDVIIEIFNKANNILPLDIRLLRDFKDKPRAKSRKKNDKKKDKKNDKKKAKSKKYKK